MPLKAKQPEEVKATKPKFMISGESGVGKTFFALQFPRPYLIDTEAGATREQYQKRLKDAGGAYFGKDEGSQDFKTVINEVKSLCIEKHDFKTLIIDSFSYLYLLEAAEAETRVGSDFGKDKKEAQKPTKQLISQLEKCDMNVILICHSKDKYERKGKEIINVGSTFDGWDKMEYILDLWCEIVKGGKNFTVKKSRISSLQQGESFPLSYDRFAELYGKDILEKPSVPIILATVEQVARLEQLLEALKVDEITQEKWKTKCDVDNWSEMSNESITSCISFCEKKVMELTMKEKK